jgi:hypothetical protein
MTVFKAICEAHHAYDDFRYDAAFSPFKTGDTVRVYHGFRDFVHAVALAKKGVSGRQRAQRVYSYEYDNNPYGLFVTLSPKVASEFVGAFDEQVIVEFVAKIEDLETPVWPAGSYTVPGQMAQYWGHGAKGRAARRKAQRDAEASAKGDAHTPHIDQSDRKSLAHMMTATREYQALFVGHLDPGDIAAFHVRPKGTREPFVRISREEFLERHADVKLTHDQEKRNRVFTPNETFDGEKFLDRMGAQFGGRLDMEEVLPGIWKSILKSDKRTQAFVQYLDNYLWPKQYIDAMKWFRDTYGKEP